MKGRIHHAQEKLGKRKLDALIISSAYNIAYLTGFFGFSKIEREGYLLITKNNIYVFASGLNSEAVKKYLNNVILSEAKNLSRLPAGKAGMRDRRQAARSFVLRPQDDMQIQLITISPRTPLTKKALAKIIKKEKIKKLGFEKHNLSYAEYERLSKDLTVTLVTTAHLIEELRMIKTAKEVNTIERACKLSDKTFDYILKKIKPGITERELAFEIELFIRKAGGEISFPPIVAFGANSSIPHHVTNDQRLKTNSWVLLDFGVKIDNYCSDMTRTIFFGKASREQKRMYKTVLESQTRAIEFINHQSSIINQKGIEAKDVDYASRSYITSQHFPTIPHSLGHGIGLEVHELPRISQRSKDILKPGMVFSIEPGIYIPNVGGIRIEDLVLLEKTGPRFLTKAKRELVEI